MNNTIIASKPLCPECLIPGKVMCLDGCEQCVCWQVDYMSQMGRLLARQYNCFPIQLLSHATVPQWPVVGYPPTMEELIGSWEHKNYDNQHFITVCN